MKSKYFYHLSVGREFITVDDLIYFLERNGMRPITEELEAILRRCDHTGDQRLTYSEFSELTAYTDAATFTLHRPTTEPVRQASPDFGYPNVSKRVPADELPLRRDELCENGLSPIQHRTAVDDTSAQIDERESPEEELA